MALKALVLISILVVGCVVPMVQSQLLGLLGLLRIQGILYCTANGNVGVNGTSTPVFPNALVQLRCGGNVVSTATTNRSGIFSILLDPLNFVLSSLLSGCKLVVNTPLASCDASLPSIGSLESTLQFLGNVILGLLNVGNIIPSAQIVRDTISPRVTTWEDVALADKQLIFDRLDNKFEYEKTNVVMAEVERLAMKAIREADPVTGELPSVIDTFEQLFHRGGQWKNDWAAQKHAEMIEFRSTQPESEVSVSVVDNMHQPKDVDIMTQVLGSRSRYVKGLGPLPKLSVVGGSKATNLRATCRDDSEKFSTMQKTIDDQKQIIDEQHKKFEALLQ
ncbi:hypothetical protein F511_11854 [Dorcoceras hygrometricum]|uniref:Uncharacterized protein n=1 Tax=Dorcoceras hygrometricum TaxID=472368 RepID=A0A2Z7BGN0_9LAMI|nr:hypothetical protein F511_11854 [Dorcoceras hygrometricum]